MVIRTSARRHWLAWHNMPPRCGISNHQPVRACDTGTNAVPGSYGTRSSAGHGSGAYGSRSGPSTAPGSAAPAGSYGTASAGAYGDRSTGAYGGSAGNTAPSAGYGGMPAGAYGDRSTGAYGGSPDSMNRPGAADAMLDPVAKEATGELSGMYGHDTPRSSTRGMPQAADGQYGQYGEDSSPAYGSTRGFSPPAAPAPAPAPAVDVPATSAPVRAPGAVLPGPAPAPARGSSSTDRAIGTLLCLCIWLFMNISPPSMPRNMQYTLVNILA
jgi:hypothetical protein